MLLRAVSRAEATSGIRARNELDAGWRRSSTCKRSFGRVLLNLELFWGDSSLVLVICDLLAIGIAAGATAVAVGISVMLFNRLIYWRIFDQGNLIDIAQGEIARRTCGQ